MVARRCDGYPLASTEFAFSGTLGNGPGRGHGDVPLPHHQWGFWLKRL